MQFIAEDPVHVVVRSPIPRMFDPRDPSRLVREGQKRLFAKFQRGFAPEYARRKALATFSFNKIHEGISREQWVAFLDTEQAQAEHGWTDEERRLVEERLVARGYVQVEPERVPAPWPAYDKLVAHGRRTIEMVAEKIAEKVAEDGYSPAMVAAYERENLNRPQVVAALEALTTGGETEDEPLLAV